MIHHIRFISLYLLFFYFSFCKGQESNSVYMLDEIAIKASRLQNFSIGNKVIELDTNIIKHNGGKTLSSILSENTFLFVRTNGISGISNAGFRGTNANHTAVLWNGFNLQSGMHGTVDINLLPLTITDEVRVQEGGASALYGSGALGSTIYLGTRAPNIKGLKIATTQTSGSFGKWFQQYCLMYGNSKWKQVTKIYHLSAKNDFPFIRKTVRGDIKVKQVNSEILQYGLLQENYFKIKKNHQLDLCFWYQNADRNLPPNTTKLQSKEKLKDETYRITVLWKWKIKKIKFLFRTAFFNEKNTYQNADGLVIGVNNSQSNINEIETNMWIGKYAILNIGLNNTWQLGKSENYSNTKIRNYLASFGSVKIQNSRRNITGIFSFRKSILEKKILPFTFMQSIEIALSPFLYFRANISENYRLPTFNELYWLPGGNPNLLPEQGRGGEVTINFNPKFHHLKFELNLTAFHNLTNHWIRWQPHPTEDYWTPQNVSKVWARGLETDFKINLDIGSWKINFQGNYSFTRSTKTAISIDSQLDKQLIYTPLHNAFTSFSLDWKNWKFRYTHRYTGKRYTTRDESEVIPSFHLGNIEINKALKVKKHSMDLFLRIDNYLNTYYEVLPSRVMPGRNFEAGLYFQLEVLK